MKYNSRTITITTPSISEHISVDNVYCRYDKEATELRGRAIDMLLNGYNVIRKDDENIAPLFAETLIESIEELREKFDELVQSAENYVKIYDKEA